MPRRCFVRRLRVVLDLIDEEEPALRDEVVQTLDARLQQLEHRKEPGVPIREVGLVPESCLPERRLETPRELVGRQAHDVLLVEPVELLLIEDGVAAADAVERERLDQLLPAEQLAVAGTGRPAEQREEIHHRFGKNALASRTP